ncbi:MAG: hypothetical protein JWO92_9 [Chitinophagaceae bacterium]|nr:hypothetical protein [Chitinophagaceae bacterium]
MKTLFIIIISGALAIITFAFFVGNPFKNSDVDLSLSIDKTDSFKSVPDADQIFAFLNIQSNKWSRMTMQINTLSNFEYNTSRTVTLSSELLLLSNPDQRDSSIEHFKRSTILQLNKMNQIAIGRPNSSIYIPMIRELNRLAKSNAKTRIAIFYSDLRENTKLFSMYRKQDQELFKTDPKKVKKLFKRLEKPENLNGIKVYLIFEPGNDFENTSFNIMSEFIKNILEDAGAEVYIGANLPPDNN